MDTERNTKGKPQRTKIPRTTQVKRLHRHAKSKLPLKQWAREAGIPVASAWLTAK